MRTPFSFLLACSFLAPVTFAATLSAPVNVTALTPIEGTVQQMPSISLTPSSTFVLWDEDTTRAGRMLANQPISSSVAVDTTASRDGGAASIGEQSFGVWMQNDWMYGQIFDASGNRVGTPVYLALLDSRHTQRLGVAAGTDRYLVVWALQSRPVASLVDMNGRLITDALQISPGTYGRNVETIHIASLGDEFLVVFDTSPDEPWVNPCTAGCASGDRDVHMVVVSADGTPKPGSEKILATGAGMPDVASNGVDDYFVVWTGAQSGTMQGVHVARGGAVVGTPKTLVSANAWGPRVAWDGKAYDLAYSMSPSQELHAVRLDANGSVSEQIGGDFVRAGVWPRQFGIAAQNGRVALTYIEGNRLVVRYGSVGSSLTRGRAVRH